MAYRKVTYTEQIFYILRFKMREALRRKKKHKKKRKNNTCVFERGKSNDFQINERKADEKPPICKS